MHPLRLALIALIIAALVLVGLCVVYAPAPRHCERVTVVRIGTVSHTHHYTVPCK